MTQHPIPGGKPSHSTRRPDRSDSGPVGFQFRDALGLGSSDNTVELWPQTEAALASRGLEIRQRIGKGGYGVVFRVRDANTGQRRAVKVLIEPGSETARQSFQREWRILDSKDLPGISDSHPVVAPQFYFGDETVGAQPFLVMEWIDGHNVEDFIGNRPTLPPEQREALCEQILLAYGRLHAANILHRDVSLRNIMIQPPTPGYLRDNRFMSERVRLIDFGSGCRKDQGYGSLNSLSSVPITEGFASDQMKARETRGSEADEVHAVARVCFYVLTGQRSDRIAPEQWRSTLVKSRIDRQLIDRIVLPRMQQPQ